MTTAFDHEITATLQELANEVVIGTDEVAAVAYRDGRRLRRRRTVLTAVAAVVALAVLATPAVAATLIRHDSTGPATRTGVTTTVTLHVTALPGTTSADLSKVRDVLRKRLVDAGIRPVTVSSTTNGEITVVLNGNVPPSRIEPVIVPAQIQFRTVIESVGDVGPTRTAIPKPVDASVPPLSQIEAKLGPAYQVALGITDPASVTPTTLARLAPFADLSPAEVSALPPVVQYAVPTVSCAQLLARPYGGTLGTAVASEIVACEKDDDGSMTKYLLDVATLGSANITDAVVNDDVGGTASVTGLGWEVDLSFNGSGQRTWSDLTANLYADADPSTNTYKQVAILVDATVLTAPQIQAAIPGPATISGGFTKTTATSLANLLRAGALPVALSITNVTVG